MKAFENEVKEKWGNTEPYREFSEKKRNRTHQEAKLLSKDMNEIFSCFSSCMNSGCQPESEQVQSLVDRLKKFITENFYNCTNDILFSLGGMYVSDERFRNNIDKSGEGTAEFVKRAIAVYCNN